MANTTPTNFALVAPYDESTTETDAGLDTGSDPIWGDEWNPHGNRWSPSDQPVGGDAGADAVTVHGDVPFTPPLGEQWGTVYPGGGSVPDARANFATDVAPDRGPTPPPAQVVRHEVHTYETGAEVVRARTVVITSNTAPTTLLDENPNRKRALIKVITSNQIIMINPLRSGGGGAGLTTTPSGNVQGWQQATGDPMLEVKSQAGVEAYGVGAATNGVLTTPISVTIWEEIDTNTGPGLVGG